MKLLICSGRVVYWLLAGTIGRGIADDAITYEVQSGSWFAPVGLLPRALSGTLRFAPAVAIYDPDVGSLVATVDLLELDFHTADLTIRLHEGPDNLARSSILPGPSGPSMFFFEQVDLLDRSGSLLESNLLLGNGLTPGSDFTGVSSGFLSGSLDLIRTRPLAPSEVIGRVKYTLSATPEPSEEALFLTGILLLAGHLFRRR